MLVACEVPISTATESVNWSSCATTRNAPGRKAVSNPVGEMVAKVAGITVHCSARSTAGRPAKSTPDAMNLTVSPTRKREALGDTIKRATRSESVPVSLSPDDGSLHPFSEIAQKPTIASISELE